MTNRDLSRGILIGSLIGVGISLMNADELNRIRKTCTKNLHKMKVNKIVDNITNTIVDMF